MSIVLDEDDGLKAHLSGAITVVDRNNAARPLPVYFRIPEDEIRAQTYPYLTLDLLGISEARERAHRGLVTASVDRYPANLIPATTQGSSASFEYPIPLNFDYQITSFCRSAQHDRAVMAAMLQIGFLPERFGAVYIPGDDTVRRLDLLSGPRSGDGKDGQGKRLFRKIWTVRMSGEVSSIGALSTYQQATVVDLDIAIVVATGFANDQVGSTLGTDVQSPS